jgi:hypothetical protein
LVVTSSPGGHPGPAATLPDRSRSRAILIGTSTYLDPALPDVPAAANSLTAMRDVLIDLGGWSEDRIKFLHNQSDCRDVVSLIGDLATDTVDALLLYYVGHGVVSTQQQLCLTLSDTTANAPDTYGIEYSRIRAALRDSPARVKTVILDCCFSGRAIEALSGIGPSALTETRGVYTLTASDADQTAHVPPKAAQAAACTSFTGTFVEVLREGMRD